MMPPMGVVVGAGCLIASSARFIGPVRLGHRVQVCDGAVIGARGSHRLYGPNEHDVLTIGDDTVIREHVTIMRGVLGPTQRFWGTRIGRNCFIMAHTHIEHDVIIGDDVIISAQVGIAGHVVVMDGANIGMGTNVHQCVTIGAVAMVGMGAVVNRDVPPVAMAYGNPARVWGENTIGLDRMGYDDAKMLELGQDFQRLSGDRPPMKRGESVEKKLA